MDPHDFIEDVYNKDMAAQKKPFEEGRDIRIEMSKDIEEWLHEHIALPDGDVFDMNDMDPMEAALTVYRLVFDASKAQDQIPAYETMCLTPKLAESHFGQGRHWRVGWESGPISWATQFSNGVVPEGCPYERIRTPRHILIQPYYRFDLQFIDDA